LFLTSRFPDHVTILFMLLRTRVSIVVFILFTKQNNSREKKEKNKENLTKLNYN